MINLRRLSSIFLAVYALVVAYIVLSFFFGIQYRPFFTPFSTLIAFIFAVDHSSQRLGWGKALLLLGLTFAVSLTFECVGVATGLIYGPYHYTDELGYKFLGLVPLLIPIAWFMMSYPSFILANRLIRPGKNIWTWRISVAAVGAVIMTAWDLAMDPMMVAGGHWIWDKPGAYFGVPLQNYWGWWLTTFVTFYLYLSLGRVKPQLTQPSNNFTWLAITSFAATGLSTIIAAFEFSLDGPALVGIFAMLPWVIMSWLQPGAQDSNS